MSSMMQLVVFHLNGQRYALPLAAVERVTGAVELTPLPGAPDIVAGVIDVADRLVPVFCFRRRFQLPQREIVPADQFLIARTERRTVALVIDEAQGVIECEPSAVCGLERVAAGLEQFQGVVKLGDGLVLIHDLEEFLSLDEARRLDEAMERAE